MRGAGVSVLHLDGGRVWAGGQNQVRLLMRELESRGVRQLCLCPRGSGLERRLREEGLPVEGIAWRGGTDPRAILAVTRRAIDFDVVHCHDAHALQVAILPARIARRKIVAARRVHFPTSRRKWNLADRVVAISETVREALLRSGVAPHRIRAIHSGIRAEELTTLEPLVPTLRERLGIADEAFLVGNIGHLHAYKGQRVIPEAAAATAVHWVIIGEGPERSALEERIARFGVGDRVHLAGAIPDARRALQEMDLFVFSSTDEPLGTSVLDAMAARIPVIGADAAGSREILAPVHERTGTSLFPPGDAAALAALVRRLAEDPAQRVAMIAAQDERLEDYRVDRTAEATLGLYRELLEGR